MASRIKAVWLGITLADMDGIRGEELEVSYLQDRFLGPEKTFMKTSVE